MNEYLLVAFIFCILALIIVWTLFIMIGTENIIASFSNPKINESTWDMVQISRRSEITRRNMEDFNMSKDFITERTKDEIKEELLNILKGHIEIDEKIDCPTGNIVLKGTIKVGIQRK